MAAAKVYPRGSILSWEGRTLKGKILEGGESLANTLAYLENIEENPCLRILELAIHMEYTAFDLYKTMAEQEKDQTIRDSFLTIAQA